MTRKISVTSGPVKYAQSLSVGPHVFSADEPAENGGNDTRPNSFEILMASLAACANITVQMYAEKYQWRLGRVQSEVSWVRILAEDPDSDLKTRMMDRLELELSFSGDLSQEQEERLVEIAGRCPVHLVLTSSVEIHTRLVVTNCSGC